MNRKISGQKVLQLKHGKTQIWKWLAHRQRWFQIQNWILGHFRFWYYDPDEPWWSSNIISEYAGILLQMKMRASASLILKRKPMAPAKPINNLNNEVGIKLWSDRKKFYFPVNDTFFLIKCQLDLKTLKMFGKCWT